MEPGKRDPRGQGDKGELSAMEWLAWKGARIYLPLGHSPDIDLIAEIHSQLLRVQVKTSCYRNKRGHWEIGIATRGGNQSWTGVVKYFDAGQCDYLFVHVGDGRRWLIPAGELDCRSGLVLGGSKYGEFEVETGRPLDESYAQPRLKSESPGECPSGQRELAVNEPAMPTQVRILPPPSEASEESGPARPAVGRTRLSSNHQLTIPAAPFESARLEVGDTFRVEALGPGRVAITRTAEFAEEHSAQLKLPKS